MYPTEISSKMDMTNLVAVVAGGGGGIGEQTCLALAESGADIAILDLAPVDELMQKIAQMGRKCFFWKADIRNKAELVNIVQEIIQKFGKIDAVINLVGICMRTRLPNVSEEEWDETMDINLKGTFFLAQAVFPHMMKRKTGSIVFTSSIAGRAYGLIGGPHYATSKAGVQALGRYLARIGGEHGIRVNCVLPGPTETTMIQNLPNGPLDPKIFPLGRTGEPADIAQAILFLASPASNWITGVWLDINGGLLMA